MLTINDKILAIKTLRQATGCLLLEAKLDLEEYVAANHSTFQEAAAALIDSHTRLNAVNAECARIREARAAEALRVTAGYTIAELQEMPDQALNQARAALQKIAAGNPGTPGKWLTDIEMADIARKVLR